MMTKHDMLNPADPRSNIAHAIDNLRMSESDRQLAREYWRSGELVGDLIFRASEKLRSAAALVSGSFPRRHPRRDPHAVPWPKS